MTPETLHTRRLLALPVIFAALTSAAFAQPVSSTPTPEQGEEKKPLQLQEVRVLGSRIRSTETEGPSPVNTYDREYIRSTGALTLADFLNTLPQNYTGIGAGRGSAPNELNPEFGHRTETSFPSTNFITGASAAPPAQSGVSGVSLRGLGSGSTLVLVDGRRVAQTGGGNRSSDSRQGFVDLNTIPLGMIERIEVITDGASALYGADAVAGVVNIVLKKNWQGNELTGTYKGAFHGGGRERSVTLTSGFAAGKLRGTVSVNYYDRSDLKANQRSFSKDQNHSTVVAGVDAAGNPIMGRDLRINWAYPGLVQARTGNLAGLVDSVGNPVRFALIRDGITGTPVLADFAASHPGPQNTGVALRRGNTARFLDIVPASERSSLGGNFTYEFNPDLELFADYTFTDGRGQFETQPPVTTASATSGFGNVATIVPAAFNPFGQDILVGMIHEEFGSVYQRTRTKAMGGHIGARGNLGETWQWETGLGYQHQKFSQITRDFNAAAITSALANPNAADRLNPFIDSRVAGITQAAIYERMAVYPTVNTESELTTFDLQADGELFQIWGGPLKAALGGSFNDAKNENVAVAYSAAVTPVATTTAFSGNESNYAGFAEFYVPLVGRDNALPMIRRLEFQVAGRYENYERSGSSTVPKIGLTWVPVQPILFRASFSEGYRAPALTEYQVVAPNFTSTVTDPRRTPANTTGVSVSRGSNPGVLPETSTNEFYGLIIEPPFLKGVNFQVNYYRTEQENVVQVLSAQTILNNESLFADRVTRAPADATDTSLNQPGRVIGIDQTFINFGLVRNESLDFQVDYLLPTESYGRWRTSFAATRTLEASRQVAPGQPAVVDEGDTFAPPKWKFNASLFWSQGPWNASAFYTFIDGFGTNRAGNSFTFTYPVPSTYRLDVRGGYEFRDGVWRGYGKGLRVMGGIGNVFDKEPPFSDTVFGYNGGLHGAWAMGRSYELSFVLPF